MTDICDFACPVCKVFNGDSCRTSDGADRLPHLRRMLLPVAELLVILAYGRRHYAAQTLPDALAVAQLAADHREPAEDPPRMSTDRPRRTGGIDLRDGCAAVAR